MVDSVRLPREVRRAQLIGAAATAFLERGYDATSMEDVARQAGVSRLIVYRIFESKADLYRAVLADVLRRIGDGILGVNMDVIRDRGAVTFLMPVARSHPDAFRLLWRRAVHEPEFADLALEFRDYVTFYAGEMLKGFVVDHVMLQWGARAAGAHLIEGVCTWLDMGEPARDDEFCTAVMAGVRALAAAWMPAP